MPIKKGEDLKRLRLAMASCPDIAVAFDGYAIRSRL